MGPDKVLQLVSIFSIHIDRKTLTRRAADGLIQRSLVKGAGRGKTSEYAEEAPAELFAAEEIQSRIGFKKLSMIKPLRELAISADKKELYKSITSNPDHLLAYLWLIYRHDAWSYLVRKEFLQDTGNLPERSPRDAIWVSFKREIHSSLSAGDRCITLTVQANPDFFSVDESREINTTRVIKESENPEDFNRWWVLLDRFERKQRPGMLDGD